MSDVSVEADRFADGLKGILGEVGSYVSDAAAQGVREGLKTGAREWRRNAKDRFKDGSVYWRSGKKHTVGKYARSVRWHMTSDGGSKPSGEIGCPKMPGLPHLLEKGHARVGGGRVPGREHIAPAADSAFDAAYEAVGRLTGEALR